MSWSIIAAWALICYCNHVVLCATSSNLSSCIACMCCRMSSSIKHVWAFPDLSSRCGHQSLFQSCCCWCYVIQPVHHILHECVVGCPILSSMYEHVPIYLQLNELSWTVHSTSSYTLCTLTSHHRVRCSSGLKHLAKHHSHVTYTPCKAPQKAVEGATALFVRLSVCSVVVDDKLERQNIARAYGTGVGARRGHWFNIASMFLLVLRHPTCASCVAWMCCRMSNSIKHVRTCPDLSLDRLGLYTFLHSLRSTSSNLCIMCCMNVLYDVRFYQACTNMSRSIIRSSLTLHLLTLFAL